MNEKICCCLLLRSIWNIPNAVYFCFFLNPSFFHKLTHIHKVLSLAVHFRVFRVKLPKDKKHLADGLS